jgi:hypothetical protein
MPPLASSLSLSLFLMAVISVFMKRVLAHAAAAASAEWREGAWNGNKGSDRRLKAKIRR